MYSGIKKKLMITLGWFFVILGVVGAFLPVMPTTVFLIIALGIFSKSSSRFHQMLLNNKYVGGDLRRWEADKSMAKASKVKATWVIVFTFVVSIGLLHGRISLQVMLVVIAAVLLLLIWRIQESKNMKNCAILTMDNLDEFVAYDKLLDNPMADCGWQTHHIPWQTKGMDWSRFDAVIIRSTWDYQEDVNTYMQVLQDIEQSGTTLLNSLKIAQWNINKNYLREAEKKGAEIIPTIWLETFKFELLESYFTHFDTEQIIIKPTISANSDNTFWLKKDTFEKEKVLLKKSLKERQLMVQPFVPAIIEEGEYSLFYFAGEYSHCILKTPKSGDFRVQEEHGGLLQSMTPCQDLLTAANKALQTIPEKVLFARIDLVQHQGVYQLMEIELIEPSLYFNLDEMAATRFAQAFNQWMK